jgi:hypothetical protein
MVWKHNGLLNPQIAPPSNSDVDMAYWFKENGDKNKSVLITNVNSGIIYNGFIWTVYFQQLIPLHSTIWTEHRTSKIVP